MTLNKKRIVITGMGLVSPLGCQVDAAWQRLINGQSGVRALSGDIAHITPSKIAGQVPSIEDDALAGFDVDSIASTKDKKRMERFILFALAASEQALQQANWQAINPEQQERTATVIASGVGGLKTIQDSAVMLHENPQKKLSPFTVPAFLANLAAGQVSIRHGFKGPLGTPVSACAAGIQAIGDAMRLLQNDEADIALCGGAESCIDAVAMAGFHAAKALSTASNNEPTTASRPFDQQRDGFIIGEGAGILVIETLAHAQNRGATILAEIVGYGTTADAYHITAAPEDGDGAKRAMQKAIQMANISPSAIDYLNAHATSTPVGDLAEIQAIKRVFGDNSPVAISSTKSATGHLLGAAGGVAAIFAVKALQSQIAPPSLNIDNIDTAAQGLNIIANHAQKRKIDYALCNGFGFGGVNASLVLKAWADK